MSLPAHYTIIHVGILLSWYVLSIHILCLLARVWSRSEGTIRVAPTAVETPRARPSSVGHRYVIIRCILVTLNFRAFWFVS